MKKKRFITSVLSALIVVPAILMFGCGKSVSNKKTYSNIQTALSTLKESGSPFRSDVDTNYYLKDFVQKDSNMNDVADDENYIILNALALDYIEKYSEKLNQIKNKYNFTALNNDAKNLINNYEKLKEKYDKLIGVESTANYIVHNGYFATYKYSVKEFTSYVYNLATSLGDLLINKAKIAKNIGTENQTREEIESYLDYQYLLVFNDYYNFFFESCAGQRIDSEIYTSAKTLLSGYAVNIVKKDIRELSKEQAQTLVRNSNALAVERNSFTKAAKNFSLYELSTKYENSIEAYLVKDVKARSYYNELNTYLASSDNSMMLYYTYVRNNIVN